MAKRRQTTGMPTKKRTETEEVTYTGWRKILDDLLGNPRSRVEQEEAINKLLVRSMTVLGVTIIALILGFVAYDQVIVPNQPVVTVNGETVTVSEFRQRVRFERARLIQEINSVMAQAEQIGFDPNQLFQSQPYSTWLNEVNFPDQLGQRVINDIVDDLLVAQEIEARNITVDSELVQSEINDFFGYDPTQAALIGAEPTATLTPTITPTPFVSPTPSPTPLVTATPLPVEETPEPEATLEITPEVTAEATVDPNAVPTLAPSPTNSPEDVRNRFEDNVEAFRENIREGARVSDETIDDYFQRLARREALKDVVTADDNTVLYTNVRHILVETEEEAIEVRDALMNGASFAALARAVSTDTGSGSRGGELGEAPITTYVQEFQDAIRELEIGEISEPVQSQFGYHIIQVRDTEEREVEGNQLDNIQTEAFDEWLTELREANEENITIAENWPDYVPQS